MIIERLKISRSAKHFSQIRDPFCLMHVHSVFEGTLSLNMVDRTESKKIQPLLNTKKCSFYFFAQNVSNSPDKIFAI
jgi:hypothetical protein